MRASDSRRGGYSSVDLDRDVLRADEGDVITSAGTAVGLDSCLHLLRSDWGAELANHRLSQVLEDLLGSLGQSHGLDDLAACAAMGRRTFTRHYRQLTGTAVGQWLLNQRLALAQRLLETTDRSIDAVAADAGLGSAASLRQHFATIFNISPADDRRQFGRGTD